MRRKTPALVTPPSPPPAPLPGTEPIARAIDACLEQLEERVLRAHALLTALDARLRPLLTLDESAAASSVHAVGPSSHSDVATRIAAADSSVDVLCRRIAVLDDRVDI